MSSSNEQSQEELKDRLKLVREIEERITEKRESPLTFWQKTWVAVIVAAVFLTWSVWTGTWPIPRGNENPKQAVEFLNQHFPDHQLKPSGEDSATAPVAAVLHMIRNGTPNEATAAINFAADQEFGYASPYVIKRLESDDPELHSAARNFLQKLAGQDYGPKATAWEAWWRHGPPRSVLGLVTLDHQPFQLAIPIMSGLIGLCSVLIGMVRKNDFMTTLGAALSVLGWFLFIGTLGLQFVGSFDTCRFSGAEITYHQSHGVVEGLEDTFPCGKM